MEFFAPWVFASDSAWITVPRTVVAEWFAGSIRLALSTK
jgi:hypothetical protein